MNNEKLFKVKDFEKNMSNGKLTCLKSCFRAEANQLIR